MDHSTDTLILASALVDDERNGLVALGYVMRRVSRLACAMLVSIALHLFSTH
jgi:hypothetical protein